jgi:exodeoxyribonuclease VII small subunit
VAATDISKLSYEEARNELASVVSDLEKGTATLEETLALWERGEALANRCEEWLLGAKARLDAARASTDAATPKSAPKAAPHSEPDSAENTADK